MEATKPVVCKILTAIDQARSAFRGDAAAQLIGDYLTDCVTDLHDDDARDSLESILDDLEETVDMYRRELDFDTRTRE